jgi:hypothetical protein
LEKTIAPKPRHKGTSLGKIPGPKPSLHKHTASVLSRRILQGLCNPILVWQGKNVNAPLPILLLIFVNCDFTKRRLSVSLSQVQ